VRQGRSTGMDRSAEGVKVEIDSRDASGWENRRGSDQFSAGGGKSAIENQVLWAHDYSTGGLQTQLGGGVDKSVR